MSFFEENEYNAELICIIGGSSKKLKKNYKLWMKFAPNYYADDEYW